MAKSSLEKMKERLKKSSPKISGRANLENMNQIRNFVFGKSKKMGAEDDVVGIAVQKAKKKITDSKNKNKKTNTTKKTFGMSPGALGGKIKSSTNKTTKNTTPTKNTSKSKITQGSTMTKKKNPSIVTKEQLKKSGLSLRDYMNFMQGKTRKDDKKKTTSPKKVTLKASQMPKKKPTMVDDFSKSKVKKSASKTGIDGAATTKKKSSKTGYGSKSMSTKTPNTYRGTNITPTKLQRERMRKRMMGST
jgi:hypothetical protein